MPLFSLASREIAVACAAPEAVPSADVAASEPEAEVCQCARSDACFGPLQGCQVMGCLIGKAVAALD